MGDEQRGTFLYLNAGHRRFHPPIPLAGKDREVYAVTIADLNRDGHMDVVTGNVEQPGSVFYNDGRGKSFREIRWNDGKGSVYGLAVGDLDGDGWPDIAGARSAAPNGLWFSTPVASGKVLP